MATLVMYDKFKGDMIDGSAGLVAFGTDTLKLALVTSAYTPGSSDQFWSTPAADEVSTGTGYSAGGSVTTATVSGQTSATTKVVLSNVTYAQDASTGFTNAATAILYKSTGTSSTSPLIGYVSLGGSKSNTGGDLVISWDATSGAVTLS